MTELLQGTVLSNTAFRAMEIVPLPKAPNERSRIGERTDVSPRGGGTPPATADDRRSVML